ncbi:molybdenum cofactor biosynthesis protein [Niveomyces insectorum RCEF 264]|uniref:Molybdenum cofactor biosynthesis protein n=1 Tax=Niveomyces insectorum RCEF 264 TaxID=1081102 RepID=A0A167USA8_9HYPO|nr:molybdenum cofactor biosynthesis protein [Niveomyces insectorum RCEF 264]
MTLPFLRAAILVVSTTAAQDPSTDAAEATLRSVFTADGDGKWDVVATKIVPDDETAIRSQIRRWTDRSGSRSDGTETGAPDVPVHLVVTTGGTGFAVSDITPEVVSSLIEKPAPGLVHGMLAASLRVTPFAVMARLVAGVRRHTLIITLPGSPKGAKENLQAVIKMLPHACVLAAGLDSRALHAGGVAKLEREAGVGPGAQAQKSDHGHSHAHEHDHGHAHSHSHGHSHGHGHGHGPVRHTPVDASFLSNDLSLGPTKRARSSPYPLIAVDEALALVDQFTPEPVDCVRPVDTNLVGYVLAEDVHSSVNVPAFRASIVDGYAVVLPSAFGDGGEERPVAAGGTDVTGVFPVVGVAHAAPADEGFTLHAGQVTRIATGAPLPAGANAVVMVEDTLLRRTAATTTTDDNGTVIEQEEEQEVEISAANVRAGDNVRAVGSDIQKGQLLLAQGEAITAVGGELGQLVAAGVRQVRVYRRPVVGVLSTGNELVDSLGVASPSASSSPADLPRGAVRDTNRPTLLLAAQAWGFDTVDLGIAADASGALEVRLRDALRRVDVLVTTGGVSMGERDLLKPTLERALGGTVHFGRVAMKPGKPTTFATVAVKQPSSSPSSPSSRETRLVFALPGNPASALVTFHLFVLPALQKLAGHEAQRRGLPRVPVVLAHDVVPDRQRPEYHRAVVHVGADGVLTAASTGGQRSSRVGSLRGANALLCLPAGAAPLRQGTRVDALLMGNVQSEL